jgi:hypothetical protein
MSDGAKRGGEEERPSRLPALLTCGVITVVILAIAIPNLIEARKHGGEASPIGALKTIQTSQALFREGDKDEDGKLDYATLEELSNTTLIDGVLGTGRKQGYLFQVRPSPLTPEFMWMAVARPIEPGETGDRYFVTNQAGVIYYTGTQGDAFELNDACEIPPNAIRIGR